ncbi:uncharacterized protein SCHCODRAFT_02459332, partial [Schizophyllum commune H4-8]|uniref:uncharacterized protein n=1 Tax=Schizophyllum commune (strain H4-8 / FGSC 9210) TaxID=578458 RepID=UPI00215FCD89
LLWICGSFSPTEIRERMKDFESEFCAQMVEYAEACHRGEFIDGTFEEISARLKEIRKRPGYQNPTYTHPATPPKVYCVCAKPGCHKCEETRQWVTTFKEEVNDILMRTNVHTCKDKYCKFNKTGRCKARMPREVRTETGVDPNTGALRFKHLEPNMNDVCSVLSYFFRCNHDCSCLLSGSAVNHIVYYITEYITKMGPQTHVI